MNIERHITRIIYVSWIFSASCICSDLWILGTSCIFSASWTLSASWSSISFHVHIHMFSLLYRTCLIIYLSLAHLMSLIDPFIILLLARISCPIEQNWIFSNSIPSIYHSYPVLKFHECTAQKLQGKEKYFSFFNVGIFIKTWV